MANETIVLYFFQGEVGESIDSPNAFVANTTGPLTFGEFLRNFPLRDSSFHYRFQVEDSKYGYTWRDIKSPNETLPSKAGIVTTKILRLDTASCLKRKTNLRLKTTVKYAESSELAPAPVQSAIKKDVASAKQVAAGKRDGPEPQRKQPVSTSEQPKAKSSKQPEQVTPQPRKQRPEVKEGNLLDGDDQPATQRVPVAEKPITKPVPVETPAPALIPEPIAKTPTPPPPMEPVLSREELAAKREALVQEQVDAALKEKRERDEAREREERELEDARGRHDKSLTAWATDNGVKRNVRTLLSTLHTVIWPDSRWKPLGLGDVLTPAQVKLAYRKAMLVVHTDKLSKLDVEKKFIGKRIFEAINEAYSEFLEKEDV